MRTRAFLKWGFCLSCVCLGSLIARDLYALPFSAESTTRESMKIANYPATPTGTPTPSANCVVIDTKKQRCQLTDDSKDLSFQRLDSGRIFEVFASKDATIDNYAEDGDPLQSYDRCTASGRYHIYWVDKTSIKPSVCVSVLPDEQEGDADSANPKIGGANGDEGRYVFFETLARNLIEAVNATPTPTPTSGGTPANTPTPTPTLIGGVRGIMVHDRKWEQTFLSGPRHDECDQLPDGDSELDKVTDDGKIIMLSSKATRIIDNLLPPCMDVACNGCSTNGSISDIFTRDGSQCRNPSLGNCQTAVIYDTFGYHAGSSTVSLLQGDSFHGDMSQDATYKVFESESRVPIHFLPDVKNFTDVFFEQEHAVSLLSQTQVVVQNEDTGAIELKNVGGPANSDSYHPKISNDGRYVAFHSNATDLVLEQVGTSLYQYKSTNNKNQVYLLDRTTEKAEMISMNPNGDAGNNDSINPWISRDGRFIIFESSATDLLPTKTSAVKNIFVRDRARGTTYLVTPGPNPSYPSTDPRMTPTATPVGTATPTPTGTLTPAPTSNYGLDANATITDVSKTGLTIAYQSSATNAVNGSVSGVVSDTNGKQDVFLALNDCPRDSDGDGTPDCLDLCPNDPLKTAEGQCGCGNPDTDTDSDGIADCLDLCPKDPVKSVPGSCGCGVSDLDTDGDTVPDCVDGCPFNPDKSGPGLCGCTGIDEDLNGNGNADCLDPDPNFHPAKPTVVLFKATNRVKSKARVWAESTFPGANVKYQFTLKKAGVGVVKTISTANEMYTFKNLDKGSRYSLNYKIKAGTTTTKSSPAVVFIAK